MKEFELGDRVVVLGHAVGTITAKGQVLAIDCGEGTVRLAAHDAQNALRPAATAEQAAEWLAHLKEPGPATLERPSGVRKILHSPPLDQVEYARMYFRQLVPDGAPRDTLEAAARLLLDEIAGALGRDVESIRREVRKGITSKRLEPVGVAPDAPSVEHGSHFHSFAVRTPGLLAVAPHGHLEREADGFSTHPAQPGWWHVYLIDSPDGGEKWWAIAHDYVDRLASLELRQVGSAHCRRSRLSVVDVVGLDSPEVGLDELRRLREQTEGFGEYGGELSAGVDEYYGAVNEQERLVAVTVEY